jgi:predicted nucleotidyltransferase
VVRTELITKLKEFRTELNKDTPISKMFLFGSRARGKPHRDSDVDLLIVSPKFRTEKRLERGMNFYKYWHLNYPVDFLCYTPEEFKKLSKQITLVQQVVKEGIEIKAS